MDKNKSIALAAGMLIIGLVAGSLIGGGVERNSKFGFARGERGDRANTEQYGAGRMMNGAGGAEAGRMGSHMMPNGQMMDNGADTGMAGMMAGMNAGLQGKTGDAFDQAFLSEMIVHHQGAVSMAELALANANHQEIKDLAKAIIAAQNKEIASMQAWQKSWYQR